jgi:urease accessory protein
MTTLAHLTGGGGLLDGLAHPIFGLDHLIAIVVVGTLAYLLSDRLPWFTLPATFVGAMALGGTLGVLGIAVGSTELFVALSVVLLGLVLLAASGLVEARAVPVLVGVAALFHGLAHGGEVPGTASPALYVLGFLLATAGLHLAGVALGPVVARSRIVRGLAGAGVVAAGLLLVSGV